MKEYTCVNGHQFDEVEIKEYWKGMPFCPKCDHVPWKLLPDNYKDEDVKVEWGGSVRCFNSKGELINMADELNRLENEK